MPSLTPWLGAAVAALVAVVLLGVAPSTASAFWEETVLNPGKTDLTGPAKTIIEKPTFLPDTVGEAASYGGVDEAAGAAGIFEAGGVLPALGSVLSFGVGTVIGSEICHVVGIEGCWYFGSEGADPTVIGGEWIWRATGPGDGGLSGHFPGYSWVWKLEGHSFSTTLVTKGLPGNDDEHCGIGEPGGPSSASGPVVEATASCSGGYQARKGYFYRSSMANRVLEYHGFDNPEVEDYEYEAPSNWSEKTASALTGHKGDASARVGEKIASEIEGSGVKDPYATEVEVPASCEVASKLPSCLKEAEELELVPEVTELDWEHAVIEELEELEPEKTREEESERIIEIAPVPGTTVETGSELVITSNPKEEDMPEFVPKPDEGETGDEFKERKFGLPIWLPHVTTLDDSSLDPEKGPNEAVRTNPAAGTRVNPHGAEGSQEVDIQQNPATVPAGGYGGGSCGAGVGSVDFSPLNQPVGSRFPFGVIAFFVAWVGEWSGASYPDPEFEFTLVPGKVVLHVDFAWVEPAMEAIRIAFLLASFVGLLWFLGTAAMKVQGDAS